VFVLPILLISHKSFGKMIIINVSDAIALRQIEINDAEQIFNTIDSQRQYLGKWLPFVEMTRKPEDTLQFIRSVNRDQELVFVMLFQGEFAGLIGFKNTDLLNRKTEIGYWLSEPFQHKGIVTESVKRLVKFAIENLQLNRVEINCAVGNLPSKKIPQRLSFQIEGIERDGELLIGNKYVDIERYSLCKRRDKVLF
jgi:ribosomal-protein-serine acetyltransferase